jgi:hypothetical protein
MPQKKLQLVVKKIFNVSMKEEERLGGNGTFPFRIFEFVIYMFIYRLYITSVKKKKTKGSMSSFLKRPKFSNPLSL